MCRTTKMILDFQLICGSVYRQVQVIPITPYRYFRRRYVGGNLDHIPIARKACPFIDQVLTAAQPEQVSIAAEATIHPIVPDTAIQRVVACVAIEGVISSATHKIVICIGTYKYPVSHIL